MSWFWWAVCALAGIVLVLGLVDISQKRHAVRRNFPVVGRLRYFLERIGPELRQYIVTGNDEERPFSRDQRRWVYSAAKRENTYFGFGTDNKMADPDYPLIRHSAFPHHSAGASETSPIPVAKVMGEWRQREAAFRPESVVNISAMSFGSLSANAVEALNRGAALAGCWHNTGEGGISRHHRHDGDLVLQLGTGYFGARGKDGKFDLSVLQALVESAPVRAIELKLSQGAKPGLGGVLPAAKVTSEIAAARGVQVGQTVYSPANHDQFDSVRGLVCFIERIGDATGLPVGIKSAVGEAGFWRELADEMVDKRQGPDFITIDGGEGGTGAAPLVFSDHVALLFKAGFAEVFATFAERSMHEQVVWIGSGKLGFPEQVLVAMALGADAVAVAREPMMAAGCIQAQRCHTGHCPTGVATQSRWLMRGLDPTDKAARVANYVTALRHGLLQLTHACGKAHPAMVGGASIELLGDGGELVDLYSRYGYSPDWFTASKDRLAAAADLMA